ncbi:MAG: hypothetical protein K2N26_02930, partial [Oscillospiraceae bacterium]|nr:hypothetical protein [Oscillospiraceae bacterium]
DIDLAMFQYYFEGKPKSEVIEVLGKYQNEDGGFGTLEYDFIFADSCLKQTESACRYIFALDVPDTHPMIPKIMKYIIDNYNKDSGEWDNMTVPEVNNFPHAPWWEHEDKEKYIPSDYADLIAHYNPNTNSALAGMVVKYSRYVPDDLAQYIQKIVVDKINSGNDFFQYGMMSDVYFVNALKDEKLKSDLLEKLMGSGNIISLLDDPWGTENAYKLCHWIDTPVHPYYKLYKDDVDKNHTFLIASQNEDGSWSPSWSWGEPEIWQGVEKRLKGLMTMKFLRSLDVFGRCEK